ncbi:MAG: hypothetical protein ACRBDL_01915 [Alphaproteobacteria bacterium]
MFDPMSMHHHAIGERYSPVNWEADIQDIMVEHCDDDPSGYRVVFYHMAGMESDDFSSSYSMGASFLENRLRKLARAGFDAPMTKKAINILIEKRMALSA